MAAVLDLTPSTQLNREQFYRLCLANPELVLERSPKGQLVIMSPVGGESGRLEAKLIFQISFCNNRTDILDPA